MQRMMDTFYCEEIGAQFIGTLTQCCTLCGVICGALTYIRVSTISETSFSFTYLLKSEHVRFIDIRI